MYLGVCCSHTCPGTACSRTCLCIALLLCSGSLLSKTACWVERCIFNMYMYRSTLICKSALLNVVICFCCMSLCADFTFRSIFFGDVSPADQPDFYVRCACELVDVYLNKLQPGGIPLVVNTHGWVKGEWKCQPLEQKFTYSQSTLQYPYESLWENTWIIKLFSWQIILVQIFQSRFLSEILWNFFVFRAWNSTGERSLPSCQAKTSCCLC